MKSFRSYGSLEERLKSLDRTVRYDARLDKYVERIPQVQVGTLWINSKIGKQYRIVALTIHEEDKAVLVNFTDGNEFAVAGITHDTWTCYLDIFLERFVRVHERTIA